MTLPSDLFTFTADVDPISAHTGQLTNSAAASTSEGATISLRSAFNSTSPANHLPAELVAKILASGAWSDWWELVALTHICQHWRNVALGTPQLWADAAQSAFIDERGWQYRYLPTFLTRSVPCNLRADLLHLGGFAEAVEDPADYASLQPHLPQLTRFSVQLLNITDFVRFVGRVGPRMPNIESLHMPQVKRDFAGIPLVFPKRLRLWRDVDFPHLHTLEISAYCFMKHIAVTSLKMLILYDGPRSYEDFLAALGRCAPGLESIILRGWTHPEWVSRARDSIPLPTSPIQLPNLRLFRASLASQSSNTDPIAYLFTSLSFSSDVTVQLDWKCNPGNARELLPKHIVGFQAPPFFDSLCLHLFTSPYTATMHCYVGDAERLYLRERPLHPRRPKGRALNDFLAEHQYATVAQLAVDFDMGPGYGYVLTGQGEVFQTFVSGLPNLRRLDLLGSSIGHAKLCFTKAFLGLSLPDDSSTISAQTAEGKTLGYVCEVPESFKSTGNGEYPDDVSGELTQLEQLLKTHKAAGGARLRRLEICVTYAERDATALRPVYPYVHNVPPNIELAASLALTYSLWFKVLVDEVVFVGHVERQGLWYRVLPRATLACPPVPGPKRSTRGGKGGTASRRLDSGRKGR